jgi:hypothetical protein
MPSELASVPRPSFFPTHLGRDIHHEARPGLRRLGSERHRRLGYGAELLRHAIKAAKEAKDPAIIACALAYRSYIPSAKGANGRARALLAEALELLPRTSSSGTLAWIAARHAEESAQLGDTAQALASWERAEEAYSVTDTDDDRVWTRFLD